MSNRFVQAIRAGSIDSIDDLKAAFRELALATHPDLADSGGERAAEAFIAVRAEYESALANFERHRFGASRREGLGGVADGLGRAAHVDGAELWACLSLLLKRGFPKEPRHEKEILRYEYARWRFRGALAARDRADPAMSRNSEPSHGIVADSPGLFDAAEEELLLIKKTYPASLAAFLAFLGHLAEQASEGHPAMRVALVRELDALRIAPGLGGTSREFAALLAAELGIGPTLTP